MNLQPQFSPGTESLRAGGTIHANHSADSKRIFSLDVLRGIALMGILVISIWEFGGFSSAHLQYYRSSPHGGNYRLLTFVSVFFEGKMRALFALVFGVGMVLFMQKKDHPVMISPADAFIRRQMWLIGFGIFNAFILLWPGDILFQYGVVGILLFPFYRLHAKGLLIAALLCTLIYCGKQYWNYNDDQKDYTKYLAVTQVEKKFKADSADRAKKDSIDRTKDTVLMKEVLLQNKKNDSLAKKNDTLTKKQAEEKSKWEGRVKGLKFDSAQVKNEQKSMRSGYGKVWDHLMPRSQNRESMWLYRIGVWDIASMMLMGMALLAFGFFDSKKFGNRYLWLSLVLMAAGFAFSWFRIHYDNVRLMDYAKYVETHPLPYNIFFPLERLLLAVGYASLILWFLQMNVNKWFWSAIASAGQMALTNYILQSVICTLIFHGYGFSYFGKLQQWELYFVVMEIALVQVVFSVFWLRYFTMGPLEWIWRCLIYRKWLPVKRTTIDSTETAVS